MNYVLREDLEVIELHTKINNLKKAGKFEEEIIRTIQDLNFRVDTLEEELYLKGNAHDQK